MTTGPDDACPFYRQAASVSKTENTTPRCKTGQNKESALKWLDAEVSVSSAANAIALCTYAMDSFINSTGSLVEELDGLERFRVPIAVLDLLEKT